MRYLILLSLILTASCGTEEQCTIEENKCSNELKENWPDTRDKAIEDTKAEWERFDDKWTAEKNRMEERELDKPDQSYEKESYETGEENPTDIDMQYVYDLLGEPDVITERIGRGGEVWKYSRDSGYCSVFFDPNGYMEYTTNMAE